MTSAISLQSLSRDLFTVLAVTSHAHISLSGTTVVLNALLSPTFIAQLQLLQAADLAVEQ